MFIDNSDGTKMLTVKKVPGGGDKVTTKVTVPKGRSNDIFNKDNNDTVVTFNEPNVDINITKTGGLDITVDESNGKHNITIANPGADVIISDEGNMTIMTPTVVNTDGSTCDYTLDIAYEGSDMITKHYLNQGLEDEIITTIIMKIPNSSIDITSDNIVKHFGSFINSNLDDVNVTGSVRCDGSVSTITKIEDKATYVAMNEPGSTVIIDIDGDVDTTNEYDSVDENNTEILVELNLKVDSDTGDVNGTKKTTVKDTNVVYQKAINKVAGTNLNLTGNKIQEVTAKLDNDKEVKVEVTDENNNTVTSTTTISDELNVTKISNGETGAVTRKVATNNTTATITIDNYLDGKARHTVNVDNKTTQATSNIEGADVNVTNTGVTTTYKDINVTAQVVATSEGKATHKMETSNGTTQATSDLVGAKTTIDKDENGDTKVVTKVSTENNNSQAVEIEVDALANGTAVHKVEVNGVETKARSKIVGAKTTISIDGHVETNATIPNGTATVIALPDGSAQHKVVLDNNTTSKATSNIKGAQTTIEDDGEIQTSAGSEESDEVGYIVKALVITKPNGEAITRFVKVNSGDETDIQIIGNTVKESTPHNPGNEAIIEQINGTLYIKVKTSLEHSLEIE